MLVCATATTTTITLTTTLFSLLFSSLSHRSITSAHTRTVQTKTSHTCTGRKARRNVYVRLSKPLKRFSYTNKRCHSNSIEWCKKTSKWSSTWRTADASETMCVVIWWAVAKIRWRQLDFRIVLVKKSRRRSRRRRRKRTPMNWGIRNRKREQTRKMTKNENDLLIKYVNSWAKRKVNFNRLHWLVEKKTGVIGEG